MQTHYHITSTGVQHAIASINNNATNNDSDQTLLSYLLKQNINGPVLFSDILNYYNNDKSLAFKKISKLISLQLIDMTELEINNSKKNQTESSNTQTQYFLNSHKIDNDYILVDLNGFPITYSGFDQRQAINISAVAYDYIKASKRSRYETDNRSLETPLSIKTSWNNIDIVIYLFYLENFSCLLITKDSFFINKKEFINLVSYLCNRYNYE